MCKRVDERIECPECGYPAGEALQPLWWYDDAGVKHFLHDDPGHTEDEPCVS